MTALISFTSLFISIFLVQMGSGSLAPLDALAGVARGFTTEEIGLLGSAHFLGFFIGCFITPRLIGTVGHSRCFAAAAAIGATGALLHPVLEGPWFWAGLRALTGIAIASAYTVVESWLQAKVENHNRGRIYGVFRVVDLLGQVSAQAMIAVLDPASYVAYNIVAVFCVICLLPLALTRRVAPETPKAPRLRPLAALRLSPSAVVGVIVAAMTGSAFRMVGPLYGFEKGLSQDEIAIFLSAAIVGGVIAQFPVGWVADKIDRRAVLMGLSALAVLGCLWMSLLMPAGSPMLLFAGAAIFGATAYPIYSVAAAYANDFAPADFIVELSAALLFYFSVGAIFSPLISAWLISAYGPDALFLFVAAAHLALMLFALYRMTRRRAPAPQSAYSYTPRTSMILARLFKPSRDGDDGTPDQTERRL
ncbi:MFS transporter [Limibaculum sp. M0105]|uniref:MFS transporter n=1 Tax=Thermohalobaculum xanthum TaxID=2753746 RepID=A0A8J7M5A9_9RHOB|nr:MFS transporter [Thermohalobaculum xanthum]MBK0398624.1 MFS transporter [Thermohalobaculum xanthum]